MTSMENCYEYIIIMPDTTDNEVLEWFAFMNSHGNLSSELVRLVTEYIKTKSNLNASASELQQCISEVAVSQDDLFNSLYNYLDSACAMFQEEKKTKKKMLSV